MDKCWSTIASIFDSNTTHSNAYPYLLPASKLVAQLPGSIYPTATIKPTPKNDKNWRQNKKGLSSLCGTGTTRKASAREEEAEVGGYKAETTGPRAGVKEGREERGRRWGGREDMEEADASKGDDVEEEEGNVVEPLERSIIGYNGSSTPLSVFSYIVIILLLLLL